MLFTSEMFLTVPNTDSVSILIVYPMFHLSVLLPVLVFHKSFVSCFSFSSSNLRGFVNYSLYVEHFYWYLYCAVFIAVIEKSNI